VNCSYWKQFVVCVFQFNHFPGSFQLGRKDRLWRNLSRLLSVYGKKDFGFFPQTFVLPADLANLKSAWEETSTKKKWIIKPVGLLSDSAWLVPGTGGDIC